MTFAISEVIGSHRQAHTFLIGQNECFIGGLVLWELKTQQELQVRPTAVLRTCLADESSDESCGQVLRTSLRTSLADVS